MHHPMNIPVHLRSHSAMLHDPRAQAIRDLAAATAATMTAPTPPADSPAGPPANPSANPPANLPADPAPNPPADPPADTTKLQGALDRERELRKDAEKRAKEGDKAKTQLEELQNAGKSEVEQAEAKGRREGAAEAKKAANGRLVRSEARALAGEAKFRDPQLVVRLLELDDVSVTEAGEVDTDAITQQLEKLKTDQPYLLAGDTPAPEQAPSPGPRPDPTQGPRGSKTSGTEVGREMFQTRRGGRKASAST